MTTTVHKRTASLWAKRYETLCGNTYRYADLSHTWARDVIGIEERVKLLNVPHQACQTCMDKLTLEDLAKTSL